TLEQLEEKTFLRRIPLRTLADGRLALRVVPGTLWDRLLLSGIRAEIWMQPGVTRAHLDRYAARAYDIPPAARQGKLALVLGAGNVASIAPLDVLHKLFIENQVCLLKLNPVNDYLHDLLAQALAPLIAMDALRIVTGDAQAGAWLTSHPAVDEIHITGSRETHD
ncbi:aldehyde dehydrogenase, partial [Klebsiella variicola]